MALKKPTQSTSFENEPTNNETAVENAPAAKAETPVKTPEPTASPAQVAEAKVESTTAIAKAASTSVGAVNEAAMRARQFKKDVAEMRGASDFAYGNFKNFKGNNGEIAQSGGDQETLGRWAQVRLMSWDDHYEISPGEQGASTKDFVGYSKDGVTIDSVIGEELKEWAGKPVADYVAYLKDEEEFANTKCRRFIDTACALLATDNGEGPIGTVIQITLSESSITSFSSYQSQLVETARAVEMGLNPDIFKMPEDPFTFFFIREVAQKGTNKWTKLRIAATLPAKI